MLATSSHEVMLILSPNAKNLQSLNDMNLTITDLPIHGGYRDTVFLREHLSHQINNALKMEKLSRTLQHEKDLLESILPQHAAEGLRHGTAVEPRLHNAVTMFFSDVVGFTKICSQLPPKAIIDMLNRLYGIMDHLAKTFHLFKIETIGDAYVCASGLPEEDPNHAINVANFAIAVQHCCQQVLSPVDLEPMKLRIGVNSGSCASGVVGATNPRYCVFGDLVNTTARHESTGEAGKVHGSLTSMIALQTKAPKDFRLVSRGMVEMKGKGAVPTYWIEATEQNRFTNTAALNDLDDEIADLFYDELKAQRIETTTSRIENPITRQKRVSSFMTNGLDPVGNIPPLVVTQCLGELPTKDEEGKKDDFDLDHSFGSDFPIQFAEDGTLDQKEMVEMLDKYLLDRRNNVN